MSIPSLILAHSGDVKGIIVLIVISELLVKTTEI